uniref:Uncharacterized protein n=1 Tax=Lygus hesperus TaxID=30085 RepID=A0A146MB40_LYGHE
MIAHDQVVLFTATDVTEPSAILTAVVLTTAILIDVVNTQNGRTQDRLYLRLKRRWQRCGYVDVVHLTFILTVSSCVLPPCSTAVISASMTAVVVITVIVLIKSQQVMNKSVKGARHNTKRGSSGEHDVCRK